MNKKIIIKIAGLVLALTGNFLLASPALSQTPPPLDLLNTFMTAISQPDATASAQAIVPLLHASLKSPDGTTLSKDVQQFSFQKAHKDAPFYKNPVEIVRENKFDQKSINLGKAPEAGTLIDYYLARKDPTTGMPAPVRVFFPADGGKPVITYIGSL